MNLNKFTFTNNFTDTFTDNFTHTFSTTISNTLLNNFIILSGICFTALVNNFTVFAHKFSILSGIYFDILVNNFTVFAHKFSILSGICFTALVNNFTVFAHKFSILSGICFTALVNNFTVFAHKFIILSGIYFNAFFESKYYDYLEKITDIVSIYYFENTIFVNLMLISVFFVYKIYYALIKSIENSNFTIKNICGELFKNVENLIIKNIQLTKEKEKIYKLLLLEKESNIKNMQYNYINKNLSEIHSDIMKIKSIIDDTETRVVKKIPLITSVINKLTKNLKNHKIVVDNDEQIILLSDIEL